MADKQLSTTREALMAELLIDVDRLLNKVGDLDQTLGETIEKSTKDAASKGFLAASLQIKRLTEDLEFKIEQASQKAQHRDTHTQMNSRDKQDYLHAQTALPKLFVVCLFGGVLGTVLGQSLLELL